VARATPRARQVRLGATDVLVDRRPDGTVLVRAARPLRRYPTRLTERLEHWAAHAPARTFLAQRDAYGAWRSLSYGDALARVRRLAQALLDRGLSAERPVAILSGNGIEHALLALAAMYAGVPYTPVAPEYSLLARDHATLRYVLELIRPGLVFAAEGTPYERALRNVLPALMPRGVEVVVASSAPRWVASTPFAALEAASDSPAVDAAHARVGPDTVAKVLFTAGSTGQPKGVVTTQRMLCSNQEMLRAVLAFLAEEPPVLCDWLPWSHTYGGSHNFGIALYNGGTLYVDEGKPTPAGIETTVRNLADVATTAYFNVPRGFELLVPWLRADEALRERFFSRLRIMFYAAAGLGQPVWDELQALAADACGRRVPMVTGLGATESAPFALCTGRLPARAGMVGLPAPGVEVKLVPAGGRYEVRLRGPNVTPGYWRQDALTGAAFDEEGFCRLGDAVRWVDPDDPRRGLAFEGRLDDDFKLSTGTWVSVGPLRARLLARLGALAQDVVVAGRDRHAPAALIFPSVEACRRLCPPEAAALPVRALLARAEVRAAFRQALEECARGVAGSSRRVVRALLLDEPPSIDGGELTSKRSVSQDAVLRRRAALVEELYAAEPSPRVVVIEERSEEHLLAPAGAAT
jgi:feruloyl-CoA synthase